MTATVTKTFEFSASHSHGGKVIGHNYILRCTFPATDASAEKGLSEKIEKVLIQKIHSCDLSESVDFLKNVPPNELSLLKVFWTLIAQALPHAPLEALSLQRDRQTQWTLSSLG